MSDEHGRGPSSDPEAENLVAAIHPDFIEAGAKRIKPADVGRLLDHTDEILAAFARGGSLRRFAREVGPMVSLVRDHWKGAYRGATYWTVAVITFVLAYVLKPVDIIPDILPVIGQLDDAVVVGHGLDMVREELGAYRAWSRDADART